MATDLSNGTGGIVSVTSTATKFTLPSQSANQEYARALVVWNEGSSTVYASVNQEAADFDESAAIPIPAGKNYPFVYNGRKPIKKLVLKCASGETSTAHYGAF